MNNIEHSGIKGMHWYQRRFQNEDGSLTAEGRLRYGVGEARKSSGTKKSTNGTNPKQTVANAKQAKKVLEERQKAEAAKKAEEERKKGKAAAINSGKASVVAKYRDLMTTQELKNAIDRINTEQSLDRLLASEHERTRGKTFIEKFKDAGEKVGTLIGTVNNVMGKVNNVKETIDKAKNFQEEQEKKAQKEANDAAEKKRKDAIDKIVNSGDINKVLANAGTMRNNELQDAIDRLSKLSTLKDKKDEPTRKAKEEAERSAEENRKKIIEDIVKTGDASAISKILTTMSDTEIASAQKRLENIEKINNRK